MELLQFKAHLHSSENFNSVTSYGDGILILCCFSDFVKTRYQLILPVDSRNVTKNLTGHRMTGPQIYQINHEDNSFQNMYGMLSATIDRLARNTDFVQKKHLPWKLWGTTVQIIYMGILVQAIVWNYSMSESSIRSTKLSVTYYCC